MATGRINRKVLDHIAQINKENKQMSLCKKFKKRSRNWQAWYTKICYQAR
jgi:hypothetical protein